MDNPAQMTDMEVRERVIKLESIIRGREELINNAVSSRIAELEKAIRYSSDYLDDNKLNSIGSGSKAHVELREAIKEQGE